MCVCASSWMCLCSFSLFFGNLYIYVAWHGKVHISGEGYSVFPGVSVNTLCKGDAILENNAHNYMWLSLCISDKDRQTVFISLTIISLVGNFLFFLIQRTETEVIPSEGSESPLPGDAYESDSVVVWVWACGQVILYNA